MLLNKLLRVVSISMFIYMLFVIITHRVTILSFGLGVLRGYYYKFWIHIYSLLLRLYKLQSIKFIARGNLDHLASGQVLYINIK